VGLSLQDQLLQAGLVSKSKANKAKQEKNKKVYQQRNKKDSANAETDKQRQKVLAKRAAKDLELNQKITESSNQREIAAQIKQLVEQNRHPASNSEDDTAFYFENKGKLKKMYVSAQTQEMITSGKLAIVNNNGVFELVPSRIAEKIRQRNASMVIELPKEQKPDIDDPYNEYQIPDDLTW
jgi:uncharacterized protein YaiL (DUF2058 family)